MDICHVSIHIYVYKYTKTHLYFHMYALYIYTHIHTEIKREERGKIKKFQPDSILVFKMQVGWLIFVICPGLRVSWDTSHLAVQAKQRNHRQRAESVTHPKYRCVLPFPFVAFLYVFLFPAKEQAITRKSLKVMQVCSSELGKCAESGPGEHFRPQTFVIYKSSQCIRQVKGGQAPSTRLVQFEGRFREKYLTLDASCPSKQARLRPSESVWLQDLGDWNGKSNQLKTKLKLNI